MGGRQILTTADAIRSPAGFQLGVMQGVGLFAVFPANAIVMA